MNQAAAAFDPLLRDFNPAPSVLERFSASIDVHTFKIVTLLKQV
ncbi:MAG TPA: hypothetical protein VG963_24755 [Polyangiaceae bacterium]|nr:hypothetical protein [Polyangiaceae bacterium]